MAGATRVKFETFEDGLVAFWALDRDKRPIRVQTGIRFQERIVGSTRYYNAELAGHQVERVIRIPRLIGLTLSGCFAVIGSAQYRIARTQLITDAIPQCLDLTLEQAGMMLDFDSSQIGAGGRL